MICRKCKSEYEGEKCPVCGEPAEIKTVVIIDGEKQEGTSSFETETVIEIIDSREKGIAKRTANAFLKAGEFVGGVLSAIVNIPKKVKVIVACALAGAVLLTSAGVFLVLTDRRDYVTYLKGHSLYYTDSRNYNKNTLLSLHVGEEYADNVQMEGKRFFYPYDSAEENKGYILYSGKKGNLSAEGDQLAIDVKEYEILFKGDSAYYLTSNGALYYTDFEVSSKIYSDVTRFYTNSKTGDLVWQTKENAIYYMPFNRAHQMVAEKGNILYVEEDLSALLFAGDGGALYRVKGATPAELISTGVSDIKVLNSESFYYLIKAESLSDDVGSPDLYRLYYHSPAGSVTVSESAKVIDSGIDKEIMFVRTGKTRAEYMLGIVAREKVMMLNLPYDQITDCTIDYTGNRFYYIVEDTLYSADVDVQNGNLIDATEIDRGVSSVGHIDYTYVDYESNECYYFKNVNGSFGDLYIGKSKIAENVNLDTTVYAVGEKEYVFCSDIYQNSNIGSLVYVSSEGVRVLGENVTEYYIVAGKSVCFISQTDSENKLGDLYIYSKGKNNKVDSGVSKICYHSDTEPNEEEAK